MLIDAFDLQPGEFITDVCIIGSGPAGLSIALELEKSGRDVLVLEAGELEPSQNNQKYYDGSSIGIRYPLARSRTRALGGSSNCWGGWCRPLEPIEFTRRPWMPYSTWPIQHSEISKYYKIAGEILNIEGLDFDPNNNAKLARKPTSSLWNKSQVVEPRIWQVSVGTRLGVKYRDHLKRSAKISLYYNACANKIIKRSADGVIEAVHFSTGRGQASQIKANIYILALGGIENARLLLNSLDANGVPIGAASGWLGKGFMEHPARINGWRIYLPSTYPPFFEENGGNTQAIQGINYRIATGFGLTQVAQRKYQLPGLWGVIGVALPNLPADENETAQYLLQSMLDTKERVGVRAFDVTWAMEQEVNLDSKVDLLGESDSLGMRKVSLSWKISSNDVSAVNKAQHLIAEDLLKRKAGRMRILKSFTQKDDDIDYGNHHIGTTRMSNSYDHGVVDRNCRVFETKNLFVAGSSVFPTSAVTNPTLSLTAMALRLADHIKNIMNN